MANELGNFIGKALLEVREEKELKQVDVAINAGITPPQLSAIETGKNVPTYPTLFKVCEALGVLPQVFLLKAIQEKDITDKRKKKYTYEYEEMLGIQKQNDSIAVM